MIFQHSFLWLTKDEFFFEQEIIGDKILVIICTILLRILLTFTTVFQPFIFSKFNHFEKNILQYVTNNKNHIVHCTMGLQWLARVQSSPPRLWQQFHGVFSCTEPMYLYSWSHQGLQKPRASHTDREVYPDGCKHSYRLLLGFATYKLYTFDYTFDTSL